ncbi:uncharacterized protein TNCV_1352081 [Trichonephila clavipes]|nr:uncharacterized protein TNCV_1352081 [Trichonephila clavipes]
MTIPKGSLTPIIRCNGSLSAIPGWTYGLFDHFDFVSKCLIAPPSLHVPTTNQVVPSPPRTTTPTGTINNYDMGWRLALRAICPATDSDSLCQFQNRNAKCILCGGSFSPASCYKMLSVQCISIFLHEFSSDKNSKYLINMPRFCNKTFKRRKFVSSKDSPASEDLKNGQEQPANSSENFCEIIDIPLFSSVLKQHVLCVKCKKQGIDIKFGRQIQDTKVYEVNTRLAYAMRSVGKGEAAAKVFCGVMNLPPPPKRFYESLYALNNATEKVAKVSMALAAAETLSFNNGNPNVPVAIDGTWQKRGHTSLNGVVMAVSVDTGKVIDAEILSRKCSCHFNGNLHSDECSANYFGNSG